MRRTKTASMKVTVYICKTDIDAEKLFREHLNKTELGGDKKFRWTSYMGSIDVEDIRTYYMTGERFTKWKEIHSGYEVITVEEVKKK